LFEGGAFPIDGIDVDATAEHSLALYLYLVP
jgi:hypothetical protein